MSQQKGKDEFILNWPVQYKNKRKSYRKALQMFEGREISHGARVTQHHNSTYKRTTSTLLAFKDFSRSCICGAFLFWLSAPFRRPLLRTRSFRGVLSRWALSKPNTVNREEPLNTVERSISSTKSLEFSKTVFCRLTEA